MYSLRQLVSGSSGVVELSQVEYTKISKAIESLRELYYIEEKLDLVTENYCEFESELLDISSKRMIFSNLEYDLAQDTRVLINRRVMNLLSSFRMYLDQASGHLNRVFGKQSDIVEHFKAHQSQLYDESLGYRLFCEIRNYVQHRGYAVNHISFMANVVERDSDSRIMHTMIPSILLSELRADKKFKASILEDLEPLGEKIDVRPLLRDYMTNVLDLNQGLRNETLEQVESWDSEVRGAIERYTTESGEDAISVALCEENSNGRIVTSKKLFVEFIERRIALVKKNAPVFSLRERFVSNELLG